MAATTFSAALRNARANAITTAVGNAGLLSVYDAVRPAGGGAATQLLVQFTMGTPFAPAAAAGVLSPTLPADAVAGHGAPDTATWARLTTAGGTWICDMDVTLTAGAGPLKLSTTDTTSGDTESITAIAITEGNA